MESEGMEIFHASGNEKKASVVISDKINFRSKTAIKDREHYMMIKV